MLIKILNKIFYLKNYSVKVMLKACDWPQKDFNSYSNIQKCIFMAYR